MVALGDCFDFGVFFGFGDGGSIMLYKSCEINENVPQSVHFTLRVDPSSFMGYVRCGKPSLPSCQLILLRSSSEISIGPKRV